jgi:hypothetical protein
MLLCFFGVQAIKEKVAELELLHQRETRQAEGLKKTIDLYTNQPELGDPKALAQAHKELTDATTRLKKLAVRTQSFVCKFYLCINKSNTRQNSKKCFWQSEVYKFKLYLSALDGTPPPVEPPKYYDSDRKSTASALVGRFYHYFFIFKKVSS